MKFTYPPESRPLPGFTLKRAIYRGGFGEVYFGLSDAGREVALKLLQHNTDIELRGVQQCLNLSHPNLVTIFDVRQDADGDHWIVMEYVSGETLEAAIRRYPRGMPVELVRKWLTGLAAGIDFLHGRGLVHRDLKPANIFIEDDVVKIGDVGLSKFIAPSRHSAHTQSVGTVYYMAPEVARGRYGKSVDVYAAGVILFEMLTGRLPFEGESTGEILMKHLTERPDLAALPERVRPVLSNALEKDPQLRTASLGKLARAFDDAILGKNNAPKGKSPVRAANPPAAPGPGTRCGFPVRGQNVVLKTALWVAFILVAVVLLRQPFFHPASRAIAVAMGIAITAGLLRNCQVRHREPPGAGAPALNIPSAPPLRNSTRAPFRDRWRLALTGNLVAVPFVVLLSALLAVVRPSLFQLPGSHEIDPAAWGLFAAVAILGSWGMITTTSLTRRAAQPLAAPRLWSALVGGIVGFSAVGLHQYLLVQLPLEHVPFRSRGGELARELASVLPHMEGRRLIIFFVVLFAVRNWNLLSSPLRDHRFRVGSILLTLVIAWGAALFSGLLPAWGVAWGAVMACSVQLASPWNDVPRARFLKH